MSYFNAASWIARLLLLATLCLTAAQPAWSAKVPSDNEQEILIRTTLMTFNDANLTGNYSVLRDKASKPFREQLSVQKLGDAFKAFQDKRVNLESIVAADMDAGNKATIDADGVLNLKGKFKDDEKRIRFDLKFVHEVGAWKLVGINVNYKEE